MRKAGGIQISVLLSTYVDLCQINIHSLTYQLLMYKHLCKYCTSVRNSGHGQKKMLKKHV